MIPAATVLHILTKYITLAHAMPSDWNNRQLEQQPNDPTAS